MLCRKKDPRDPATPLRGAQPLSACPPLACQSWHWGPLPISAHSSQPLAPQHDPRIRTTPILASCFPLGVPGHLGSSHISPPAESIPLEVSFLPPPQLRRRTMRGQTFSNTCRSALTCTGMYGWFFPSSTKTALFGAIHQRIAPPPPPARRRPHKPPSDMSPCLPAPGLTTTFRNALH